MITFRWSSRLIASATQITEVLSSVSRCLWVIASRVRYHRYISPVKKREIKNILHGCPKMFRLCRALRCKRTAANHKEHKEEPDNERQFNRPHMGSSSGEERKKTSARRLCSRNSESVCFFSACHMVMMLPSSALHRRSSMHSVSVQMLGNKKDV